MKSTSFDFTWFPDSDWTQKRKPSVNETKFGDGFALRVPTGLNNDAKSFSLSFTKNLEEMRGIEMFFSLMGGTEIFGWKTPTSVYGHYICREWTTARKNPAVLKIDAVFQEVFEAKTVFSIDFDAKAYKEYTGSMPVMSLIHSPAHYAYMLPNHPIFSIKSNYSNPVTTGGEWKIIDSKNVFVPSDFNRTMFSDGEYMEFFTTSIPDSRYVMLSTGELHRGAKP